jgi:FMN phosphatase YigB (HAD superfamily)
MGWIGVDLDGTLAHYTGWNGHEHIGEPVPLMLERVKKWIAEGQEVRIFTARASVDEHVEIVEEWCLKHVGRKLEVTNVKDYKMIQLWDDRAVQVLPNTGRAVLDEVAALAKEMAELKKGKKK